MKSYSFAGAEEGRIFRVPFFKEDFTGFDRKVRLDSSFDCCLYFWERV
jgi:hypothetical protein